MNDLNNNILSRLSLLMMISFYWQPVVAIMTMTDIKVILLLIKHHNYHLLLELK